MSGGTEDIERDNRRARSHGYFLDNLLTYLKDPSKENYKEIEKSAEDTDAIRGGYWGGGTSLSQELKGLVGKLEEGDKKAWAKFLYGLNTETNEYGDFKSISPLAEEVLIGVDFGSFFVTYNGEADDIIRKKIKEAGGKAFDGDKYLITLPKKELEKVLSGVGIVHIEGRNPIEPEKSRV